MQQINIYLMECGWFQVVGRMMVCLALVFMAYKDMREHKVAVIALIVCGLITGIESGIAVVTGGSGAWKSYLAGLVIGSLFIVISKATREGLGYGDSWLMCILGGYLGIWSMLELLVVTWMLTAVVAGIILARSRFKKRTSMPLVPLITVGYIAVWLSEIMMATNA